MPRAHLWLSVGLSAAPWLPRTAPSAVQEEEIDLTLKESQWLDAPAQLDTTGFFWDTPLAITWRSASKRCGSCDFRVDDRITGANQAAEADPLRSLRHLSKDASVPPESI